MNRLFNDLRTVFRKRAAYERTAYALAHMPMETAHDLDLDPSEARKNAHRAVYGY